MYHHNDDIHIPRHQRHETAQIASQSLFVQPVANLLIKSAISHGTPVRQGTSLTAAYQQLRSNKETAKQLLAELHKT